MSKIIVDPNIKQINLFDERWYEIKLKGQTYDLFNVTGWLDAYPKGPGFDKWLMTVKDPETIRNEAAQLGTEVHDSIERTLKGETVKWDDTTSLEGWERFLAWCKWWKEFTAEHEVIVRPEFVEFITYDLNYRYAGTVDLLAKVDNKIVLIDWKTGANIYDTALLQISAYAQAVEQQLEKVVERALIVQLNPSLNKKGYRIKEVKSQDLKDGFEDFKNVQKVYLRANKDPKPRHRRYPMEVNLEYIKNEEIIK